MACKVVLVGLAMITRRSLSFSHSTPLLSKQLFAFTRSSFSTHNEYEKMTVPNLKALLREKNLLLKGKKAELITRLVESSVAPEVQQPVSTSNTGTITKSVKSSKLRAPRTPVIRPYLPRNSPTATSNDHVRAISWNVNGLRALLRSPQPFVQLLQEEKPHIICLQETKLQEANIFDCENRIQEIASNFGINFGFHWSCSTKKLGYSGVVIMYDKNRMKPPVKVTNGIGLEVDQEGRAVTLTWAHPTATAPTGVVSTSFQLSLVNVYAPNSGQGLKRLDFRCSSWDPALSRFLKSLSDERKTYCSPSVLLCGDLNVAYADEDFYNPNEKRMEIQAGTTPEERANFARYLVPSATSIEKKDGSSAFFQGMDCFRHIHGDDVQGVYSYWSQRARNREVNRGMRLDYFLASLPSKALIKDSFVLDHIQGSDHCPVGVDIQVPEGFLN